MSNWLDWRPPRGGIAFLAGCFMLAGTFFAFAGGDSSYTRWVGPLFLPLGVGLWLKHAWARWLTFAFFVAVSVMLVTLLFTDGFTVRRLVQGIIVAGALFALWEWDVYPEEHDERDDPPSPL